MSILDNDFLIGYGDPAHDGDEPSFREQPAFQENFGDDPLVWIGEPAKTATTGANEQ